MRKKINRRLFEIAIFSIVITTIVMTSVFYTQLKRQVFSDLQDVAGLLIEEGSYEKTTVDFRITLILKDGTVIFDSIIDAKMMENHLNRPEVRDAVETGFGKGMRRSDTLSATWFYYAQVVKNDTILRVGKEAHSVVSVFLSALPGVCVMVLLLAGICFILSQYLTTDIVKPIEELAGELDHITSDIYPELVPFATKIQTQHEQILQSANIRQEFTANVSHELKTPLTAISGYAELMESGLANEKDTKHFSGEIRKSAARLLSLINDIIRLSELDSGMAKDTLEIVNLSDIAEESVEMLRLQAQKDHITIRYQGVSDAFVRMGKELAQELVYNLIQNAVRYNKPHGFVYVRVKKADGIVIFEVQDTGIGIAKEHQDRVFERFYRVDKSRSKQLGGTGLGLAIVKHICTVTDGELSLESEPDKGTIITVKWKE